MGRSAPLDRDSEETTAAVRQHQRPRGGGSGTAAASVAARTRQLSTGHLSGGEERDQPEPQRRRRQGCHSRRLAVSAAMRGGSPPRLQRR